MYENLSNSEALKLVYIYIYILIGSRT